MASPVRAILILILAIQAVSALTYDELHTALIQFYGYQRAGTKVGDPHNPFYTRTPYPHQDDNYNGTALDGGWYDAGDFVKFGLPLGYTVYCLLKGYDAFPQGYSDKNSWDYTGAPDSIPDILNEAKVATDYLIKAVISQTVVIRDVGNAASDHNVWASGYDSKTNRQAYACDGADVPALYAAALALMSQLYKKHDAAYAATCLQKAQQAYAFAGANPKVCSEQNNGEFYKTTSWQDKMACAAIELYRATNTATYLTAAKTYMGAVEQHFSSLGYAHCGDLAAFEFCRLGEPGLATVWFSDVNYAIANRVVTSNSPGCALVKGAFVNQNWAVCGSGGGVAFSAALAYLIKGDDKYRDFAVQEINWFSGIAPFTKSYITRVNNGPSNPHHRNNATLPQKIMGALLSGPNANVDYMDPTQAATYTWSFNDQVMSYTNTEPALDYNAGAVGAVAFKKYYDLGTCQRVSGALTATPERIDFQTAAAVSITGSLENAIAWQLTLKGRSSTAQKIFTGTGKAISASWNGSADQGAFQAGEIVDAALKFDNMCDYHQGKASTTILIVTMKDAAFGPKDVLIDDFNDSDLINRLTGGWEGFSDRSDSLPNARSSKPALSLVADGKDSTKALNFRITATSGATHPYAGVRTWFKTDKSAVSVGSIASIVFDVKPSAADAAFRVELEQSDITDGSYNGAAAMVSTANIWQRVRLPISSFVKPSWATVTHPLNSSVIKALRFVVYEGSASLTIDNVHIEGLAIGASVLAFARRAAANGFVVRSGKGSIAYAFPFKPTEYDSWEVAIVDVAGRSVYRKKLAGITVGSPIALADIPCATGIYSLVHVKNGAIQTPSIRIAVIE
jgi:hypothetical protein